MMYYYFETSISGFYYQYSALKFSLSVPIIWNVQHVLISIDVVMISLQYFFFICSLPQEFYFSFNILFTAFFLNTIKNCNILRISHLHGILTYANLNSFVVMCFLIQQILMLKGIGFIHSKNIYPLYLYYFFDILLNYVILGAPRLFILFTLYYFYLKVYIFFPSNETNSWFLHLQLGFVYLGIHAIKPY